MNYLYKGSMNHDFRIISNGQGSITAISGYGEIIKKEMNAHELAQLILNLESGKFA